MNVEKIKGILKERVSKHPEDDYGIEECWDRLLKELTLDLNDTMNYFDHAEKDELYWISEIFQDLSEYFKSEALIECMKRNALRTGADCDVDIEFAIKALNY